MSKQLVLPRAMPWTLLDYGSDLVVVLAAFSPTRPLRAEIQELAKAPSVRNGTSSRLALGLYASDGKQSRYVLDAVPEREQQLILESRSLVVVEEERSGPKAHRHSYVAKVVCLAPEANAQPGIRS